MLLALGTAVLASVVPYTLKFAALRRAPRRVFGTLLSLKPAVAALAGLVLLGQRVPAAAAGAIALVIAARAGATVGARPRQPAAAGASAFADTGGVGSHASPGSTTNL